MMEIEQQQPPLIAVDLTALSGVVLHQRASGGQAVAQSLGIPFQKRNAFHIMGVPDSQRIADSPDSPDLWAPRYEELEQLPDLFMVLEESSGCLRCCITLLGCRGARTATLHVTEQSNSNNSRSHAVPVLRIEKPCRGGGMIGCPYVMRVHHQRVPSSAEEEEEDGDDVELGYVKENYTPYGSKCYKDCCNCTFYHDVYHHTDPSPSRVRNQTMERGDDGTEEPRYRLKIRTCCCGPTKNTCAGSCFNPNTFFDVIDVRTGDVVAHIQKMYAPGGGWRGCRGLGRCLGDFDTMAIGFPHGSTQEERIMLIVAVLQVEYQLFEEGGADGGGSAAKWILKIIQGVWDVLNCIF